jgi:hypothetical protein
VAIAPEILETALSQTADGAPLITVKTVDSGDLGRNSDHRTLLLA